MICSGLFSNVYIIQTRAVLLFNDPWKCFPILKLCRIYMCEWQEGKGLTICVDFKGNAPVVWPGGPQRGPVMLGSYSWV